MKKVLMIVLVIAGLTVLLSQAVMAGKLGPLSQMLSKILPKTVLSKLPSNASSSPMLAGEVLGDAQETPGSSTEKPEETQEKQFLSLPPKVQSVIRTISTAVGSAAESIVSAVTGEEQKIEVDKAIQDAKEKAAAIPGEVFERAKYEYCKQVIVDFESNVPSVLE